MILNDKQILELAPIQPVVTEQRSKNVISYGLSSFGYDIRLAPYDFRIFRNIPGQPMDPKKFNTNFLVKVEPQVDADGYLFYVLPANSYALGVSLEHIEMPKNVTGVCLGKSTYARCGIIVNMTPIEAGWNGYLTIEISNSSAADAKVYATEGIAQILFFQGERCFVSYADRKGKYQSQGPEVTLSKVKQ